LLFVPYIDIAVHQLDANGRRTEEFVGVLLGRISTPTTIYHEIDSDKEDKRLGSGTQDRPTGGSLSPASRHHAMG